MLFIFDLSLLLKIYYLKGINILKFRLKNYSLIPKKYLCIMYVCLKNFKLFLV